MWPELYRPWKRAAKALGGRKPSDLHFLDKHNSGLRGLTFELSGRQRQDARARPEKMYTVPQAGPWRPAVGAPLERGVRPRSAVERCVAKHIAPPTPRWFDACLLLAGASAQGARQGTRALPPVPGLEDRSLRFCALVRRSSTDHVAHLRFLGCSAALRSLPCL
jgi:hypothetical protein